MRMWLPWLTVGTVEPMMRLRDVFGHFDIAAIEKLPREERLRRNTEFGRTRGFSKEVGSPASVPAAQSSQAQAVRPIRGMVGVGTWGTQAEFKDIKVTQGNKVLYASDFSKGLQDWKTTRGTWEVVEGALRQTGDEEGALALIGNPTWSDYTLTLKARKISGSEGFLILFGVPDENTKSWWNVGGWGNTLHAVQAPATLGNDQPGKVETGRWYDLRIELKGNRIHAFLDDQLFHVATQRTDR